MFCESPKIKWKKLPFKKANKLYNLGNVTGGAIDPTEQEIWPEEEPAYFIHEGDVVSNGPAIFGAEDDEDATAYVIVGDLKVNGPLIVFQGDYCGVLMVTGSVSCTDCLVADEGHLVVGGRLSVTNTLTTSLGQMGALYAGELVSTDWLETRDTGLVKFGKAPTARFRYLDPMKLGSWPPSRRTEGSSTIDFTHASPAKVLVEADHRLLWNIKDAMIAGKPILAG
ncbi:hypothetical protein AKJ09_01578 [Labilithrix luteola]|uniref:Uncharacterized protein n=1 Tax=Labilithrix luteola TaxID=1391654 RepID=A0A0K1PP69_9BACT|nr:hypothetical protein [Labilithrix luteola]AKU94914.1 hypothetical protein AKJ09_01578 [Labilithrix luteola]